MNLKNAVDEFASAHDYISHAPIKLGAASRFLSAVFAARRVERAAAVVCSSLMTTVLPRGQAMKPFAHPAEYHIDCNF
ncbi:MAG: hypothetical protein PHD65_09360 [Gallionella sp.]|nr:hypothetical protein [Gallionella sp.]